jgi:hypothetical protein
MAIIAEIVLRPPIHSFPAGFAAVYTPWLILGCGAILSAAALIHWQRSRHWCLLALAMGALLSAIGALAQLAFRVNLSMTELPSGDIRLDTTLLSIGVWLLISGLVVGATGGIGAIHWGLRLRRRTEIAANAPQPQSGSPLGGSGSGDVVD